MNAKRTRWPDFLLIILLLLFVGILNSFTYYLARLHALENQAGALRVEATMLAATQQALEAAMATATSEAAVAIWAHEHGMAAPGEQLVVPLPAGTPLPTPPPQVITATPPPVWQLWWQLFFGNHP